MAYVQFTLLSDLLVLLYNPNTCAPLQFCLVSMPGAALQQSQLPNCGRPNVSCGNCVSFLCLQVLQDLHAEHTTVTLDEQGSLVGIAPATDLAKPLQEQCRRVVLTCNELLRHFWACLPLTTQPRRDKAARLDRALQAQYDRCVKQAAAQWCSECV
jgi:hypothetical protein